MAATVVLVPRNAILHPSLIIGEKTCTYFGLFVDFFFFFFIYYYFATDIFFSMNGKTVPWHWGCRLCLVLVFVYAIRQK